MDEPTQVDRGSAADGAPHEARKERPLSAYGAVTSAYGAGLVASLIALSRAGRLPERLETRDLILAGVASHKLSRLITKDKVTSFLRAPFTSHQEESGRGEVSEKPQGGGAQRAMGELLVCPYCTSHWIATAFTIGLAASPRVTRLVSGIFVAETISDFLQTAYLAAEKNA